MLRKIFLIIALFLPFLASSQENQEVEEVGEQRANLIISSQEKGLSLGFVNFRRIMSSLPQLGELKNRLDIEFKNQNEALNKAQEELLNLERENLEKTSDDLAQKIIAKRREIARLESNYRDDYSVRRNEEIAKLQNLVMDEIVLMAKEKNFDVILNDNGVLFVSEKADLTQDVIKRLLNKAK